jgi:hypothetical protein
MNPVAAVDLFERTSSSDLRVLPKYTLMICAGKSPKTVAIKYTFVLILLTCRKAIYKDNLMLPVAISAAASIINTFKS